MATAFLEAAHDLVDQLEAIISEIKEAQSKNLIDIAALSKSISDRLDSITLEVNSLKQANQVLTTELQALAAKWEADHSTPSPTPTPTPIPVPTPIPSPSEVHLVLAQGMTDGFEVTGPLDKRTTSLPPGVKIRLFIASNVRTTIPSAKGLTPGDYADPLVEVDTLPTEYSKGWVEFTNLVSESVNFTWNNRVIHCSSTRLDSRMPFYTEIKGSGILAAHKLSDNVTNYGKMVPQYIGLLREHGIEPIKQAIYNYNTDVNQWSQYNCSFKQLVLTDAIAPPCLFGFDRYQTPSISFLKDIESQIQSGMLPKNSWCYAWDEGYPQDKAAILTRVKLIRENAPSLKIMITYIYDSDLAKYVDSFCPVLDWFDQAGWPSKASYPSYGLYTSCMANGNCQNKTSESQVASASGTPMMVLDSPRIHQRAFPVMVKALGGSYALYFKADQMLASAFTNQYSEGGNGDGTLLYPGVSGPLASLRLKYIRKGINDCAFMSGSTASPITSPFQWSKDPAHYDAIRAQYAKAARWI